MALADGGVDAAAATAAQSRALGPAHPMTHPLRLALVAALAAASAAQTPTVSATRENMRLQSHGVAGSGTRLTLQLVVDDDNGNASLPTSLRRWWHCRIGNLDSTVVTTLDVRVQNAGYSDAILPVWSRSADGGQTFGDRVRVPTSATPVVSGSTCVPSARAGRAGRSSSSS